MKTAAANFVKGNLCDSEAKKKLLVRPLMILDNRGMIKKHIQYILNVIS